jgi:hypothetical protein
MVSTLTAALIALSSLTASAVSTGADAVQWQADYGEALAATRQDDRPLLVVLDVPDDPKSAVETEQFEIEGEQGKLLESYQLCHVDVSTKYGKKVAEAFRAKQFPFTAITGGFTQGVDGQQPFVGPTGHETVDARTTGQ